MALVDPLTLTVWFSNQPKIYAGPIFCTAENSMSVAHRPMPTRASSREGRAGSLFSEGIRSAALLRCSTQHLLPSVTTQAAGEEEFTFPQ